ncbi:MAG: DinB family protein [Terriglobales bacterium]|jgi:uncharacterized damage-inducible protein DinB
MTTPAAAAQSADTPDFAIAFTGMIVQNLSREMEATRKVLAAVPETGRDYRPDPKSRTAFELAWHLASADVQFLDDIADRKFTMEPRFKEEPKTTAELADWYAKEFSRGLARVQAMTADQLLTPVDFYGVMTAPVFRFLLFANNHSIHHRGQLAAYLRPMGSKVPSIYGGSADEPWPGQTAA